MSMRRPYIYVSPPMFDLISRSRYRLFLSSGSTFFVSCDSCVFRQFIPFQYRHFPSYSFLNERRPHWFFTWDRYSLVIRCVPSLNFFLGKGGGDQNGIKVISSSWSTRNFHESLQNHNLFLHSNLLCSDNKRWRPPTPLQIHRLPEYLMKYSLHRKLLSSVNNIVITMIILSHITA